MPSPKPIPKTKKPFMPAAPRTKADGLKELAALCRSEDPANFDRLVALRDDPQTPPVVVLGVINTMYDRGHGKPAQTVNTRVIRSFGDLTDSELAAIVSSAEAEEGEGSSLH
jgi:hypothetical protein